jgi:hypothetical protein
MINLTLAIVTVLSLIVAAIMTVVAWTLVRDERRRAAARAAILAKAIHEHEDLPLRPSSGAGHTGLFVEPPSAARSRLTAAGVGAVLLIGAITGFVLLAEGRSRPRPASGAAAHVERPPDAPLDLVALEHDRDENRLVIRGIVRNPASAATLSGLTAVVLVFSRDGELIATERAATAVTSLAAGAETPFVVTLPDADSVYRYRVSFRTDDRIVPHIDRRGRNAVARTE